MRTKCSPRFFAIAGLMAGFADAQVFAAGVGCYADEILADGPMAYWRFSERSGDTVVDAADSGLTLTAQSGLDGGRPLLGQPGALDRDLDPAARMAGGYLKATGTLSIGAASSVEAWFNCNSGTGQVVSISGGDLKARAISCDKGLVSGVGDHSASWPDYTMQVNSSAPPAWHHAVFVAALDGGTTGLSLYIDGVLARRCTAGACDSSGPGPAVAMASYTASPFVGKSSESYINPGTASVDEVAIYGKALTPERVAAHFAAGRRAPPLPDGSVCCYPSDCASDNCAAGTCGAAAPVPPALPMSGCASWPASSLPVFGALAWLLARRRVNRRRVG